MQIILTEEEYNELRKKKEDSVSKKDIEASIIKFMKAIDDSYDRNVLADYHVLQINLHTYRKLISDLRKELCP